MHLIFRPLVPFEEKSLLLVPAGSFCIIKPLLNGTTEEPANSNKIQPPIAIPSSYSTKVLLIPNLEKEI